MGRPAAEIDVPAVGSIADDDGLETEAREQAPAPRSSSRRSRSRCADPEPARARRLRKHGAQMIEVRADEVGARNRRRRRRPVARPRRVGDDRFDLAFDALGELLAPAREHLDAVVLERIVRRRDDDAGVVARAPRQIRDRRRRHDAGAGDGRLRRRRRARARASIQAPDSRVSRPTSRRGERLPGSRRQRPHQRRAEPAHRRRIERRRAGRAADAVGAEQTWNASQFLRTGDSHLHRRGLDARDAGVARASRRGRSRCTRRRRGRPRSTYAVDVVGR